MFYLVFISLVETRHFSFSSFLATDWLHFEQKRFERWVGGASVLITSAVCLRIPCEGYFPADIMLSQELKKKPSENDCLEQSG